MRYMINDKKYIFKSAFDTETGAYVRTGILDENGKDTGTNPFRASFPHLIDVGVMGHCIHGKMGLCVKAGIGCYQSGLHVEQPNMSVEVFRWIAKQCGHRCNQLALGGRGDAIVIMLSLWNTMEGGRLGFRKPVRKPNRLL